MNMQERKFVDRNRARAGEGFLRSLTATHTPATSEPIILPSLVPILVLDNMHSDMSSDQRTSPMAETSILQIDSLHWFPMFRR